MATKESLGIRLNNPGNIELNSIKWKGLSPIQLHKRFATFTKPEFGLRAIARILMGDWREGQNTIASLISEWAPEHENPTDKYIAFIGKEAGVDPYKAANIPVLLPKILPGIVKFENGYQPYSKELIQLAIDLEKYG
jgi:hypothetical protein